MGIEIDVSQTGQALMAQRQEGEDRVVQIAKAVGAIGQAVMGAAAGDMDRACAVRGEEFGGQMNALFERDRQASRAVTLEAWERRGLGGRLMEGVGRLLERWL